MSGSKIFLDTNIVLYLLGGDTTLVDLLENKKLFISIITEMELLGYNKLTKSEEKLVRKFISECSIIPISEVIKEKTIEIRRKYKTKLPDSIIIASALYLDVPLITADSDFSKVEELTLGAYNPHT